MQRRERGADVVDELQRLGDDRAVEGVGRDVRRVREVADDRRLRVPLLRHQDVDLLDAGSVASRVVRSRDLEDVAANVRLVSSDEALDVDAVDRRAALEAPVRVDGRDAPQVAEIERASLSPVDERAPDRPEAPAYARGYESSPAGQGTG